MSSGEPGKLSGVIGKGVGAVKEAVANIIGDDLMKSKAELTQKLSEAEIKAARVNDCTKASEDHESKQRDLDELKDQTEGQIKEDMSQAEQLAKDISRKSDEIAKEKSLKAKEDEKMNVCKVKEMASDRVCVAKEKEKQHVADAKEKSKDNFCKAEEHAKKQCSHDKEKVCGDVESAKKVISKDIETQESKDKSGNVSDNTEKVQIKPIVTDNTDMSSVTNTGIGSTVL